MNTPAILNPIAAATPARQHGAQADNATSDVSFNQVLSREVANRQDSPSAERTPANAAPSSAAKGAGKSTDKDKTKEHDDKSTADTADTSAQAAPANLLALVANIGQVTGTDKTAKAAPSVEQGKADVDVKLGINGVKPDAAAQIDTTTKAGNQIAAAKDAAVTQDDGKTVDFAAELKRGAELQQQPTEVAAAKAQIAQPAQLSSEASALETAIKATDTANAPPAAQALATLTTVQQTAQAAMHMPTGQIADRLAPQVGTPAWDNALSQRVVWMVAGGEQSASLTLNPPDLGPLQVVLNVSNSTANATFVAAQPEVRQALEAAMPKLRDMLGEAGIQLGQTTVSSGGSQQNQNGAQPDSSHRTASAGATRVDNVDTQARVPRSRIISSGNGLVDTFV